jgi:hypothetical protein
VNHYLSARFGVSTTELTYPEVTSETDSEEHGKDYNSLGPELITILVLPISVRLHQEDAAACQLSQITKLEGELTA